MSDISYAPFITPFASPAMGRIDASALGQAGQLLSEGVRREQERKDRLAEQQRRYELDQSEAAGKNDYYAAQAQTHRMAVEQSKNAATEKRAQALFDAFRKSKTPQERQAVRDELQRLGFSVEETDTELPDPTAAATPAEAIASTTTAPAVAGTKVKTPKVSKKFASALGQFMTDENDATVAPEEQSPASPFADPSGVAATAMGAMPAAAPAVPKASRGGRFVIRDKSGIQVQSYDEPVERMKGQTAIRSTLGAMGLAAVTDRERAATQAASEAGAQMLDLGLQPAEAVKYAVDIYGKTLKQEYGVSKVKPAGGGGPGGPSKIELRMTGMDREQADKIIKRVDHLEKAPGQVDGLNMARRALASLDSGSGMGDLDAFKSYLVQMSGKVVTDKEMDQFMKSEGAWTGWEAKVNQYAAQGRFPEEFTKPLRAMFERFIKLNEADLARAGSSAMEQARLSKLSPEQQAIVRGHFTGNFAVPGGAQEAAPAAGSTSDEDLVRAWKGSK